MTIQLEELITQSGENAETKGFHDDGNKLRTVLGLLENASIETILHIDTADGLKYVALDKEFWDRIYAAYKGNRLMLAVGELVEVHEEVRSGKPPIYEKDGKPEGTAVELADVQIRLADYVWEFEEPMTEAIGVKAEYNSKREKMHGGRKF